MGTLDTGRYGQIRADTGRYGEMRGDARRYGEIQSDIGEIHQDAAKKPSTLGLSAKTSVRPLRVCYCCLREAYEKGRSWDWAIKMS